MQLKLCFLAICLAVGGCEDVEVKQAPNEEEETFTMVVPDATPAEELRDIARTRCEGIKNCSVWIWPESRAAAATIDLTEQEGDGVIFIYVRDGVEQSYWQCSVYPRPDKSECFPTKGIWW